jgi:hypothetical protein
MPSRLIKQDNYENNNNAIPAPPQLRHNENYRIGNREENQQIRKSRHEQQLEHGEEIDGNADFHDDDQQVRHGNPV